MTQYGTLTDQNKLAPGGITGSGNLALPKQKPQSMPKMSNTADTARNIINGSEQQLPTQPNPAMQSLRQFGGMINKNIINPIVKGASYLNPRTASYDPYDAQGEIQKLPQTMRDYDARRGQEMRQDLIDNQGRSNFPTPYNTVPTSQGQTQQTPMTSNTAILNHKQQRSMPEFGGVTPQWTPDEVDVQNRDYSKGGFFTPEAMQQQSQDRLNRGVNDQTPQLPGDPSQPAYFDNEYVKDNIDGLRSRMNIVPGMKLPQQQQAPQQQQQYNRPDYSYSPFNHGREKGDWVKSSTLDREAGLAKAQMSDDTTQRGQDITGQTSRNTLANTQKQQDFTNRLDQSKHGLSVATANKNQQRDLYKMDADPKYQYGELTATPNYMKQYNAILNAAGFNKGKVDPKLIEKFNANAAKHGVASYETFNMLHNKYGKDTEQF